MEVPRIPKLSASERQTLLSARRFVESSQFDAAVESAAAWARYVNELGDGFASVLKRLGEVSSSVNESLAQQTWSLIAFFPDNLWGVWKQPDTYAPPALDDGIPVAWVVPPSLLEQLVKSSAGADRRRLLLDNRDDLLTGCVDLLKRRPGRWSDLAREAVDTALAGHDAAAQSHAANVVDSLVLVEYADDVDPHSNRKARERAKLMSEADLDEREKLFLEFARELTSLPFKHALARWFPGDDPPSTFNLQPTCDCALRRRERGLQRDPQPHRSDACHLLGLSVSDGPGTEGSAATVVAAL